MSNKSVMVALLVTFGLIFMTTLVMRAALKRQEARRPHFHTNQNRALVTGG